VKLPLSKRLPPSQQKSQRQRKRTKEKRRRRMPTTKRDFLSKTPESLLNKPP